MITTLLFFVAFLLISSIQQSKKEGEVKSFKQILFTKKNIFSTIKVTIGTILVFLNVFCVYSLFNSPYQQNVSIDNLDKFEFSVDDYKQEDLGDGSSRIQIKESEFTIENKFIKEVEVDKEDPKANSGVYTQSKVNMVLNYRNDLIEFLITDFFLDKTNLFKNNTNQIDKISNENYRDIVIYKSK